MDRAPGPTTVLGSVASAFLHAAERQIPPGAVRVRYRRLAAGMAVTDGLATLTAFLSAYWINHGLRLPPGDFLAVMIVSAFTWIGLFAWFDLYGVHRLAPPEEFRRLLAAVSVGVASMVLFSYWSSAPISRKWVALSWVLSLAFILSGRRVWHWWMRGARERGELAFPTLIVGTNGEATHLARVMGSASLGYRPVGFVAAAGPQKLRDLPVVGRIEGLHAAIRDTGAECVFVASSDLTDAEMREVTKAAARAGVEVRISANLPEMMTTRLAVQPFGGLMALSVRPVRLTQGQAVAKRVFDVVVSLAALVVTLPLFAVIAVGTKLSSRGAVLYRQTRVGRHGRPFTLLKFRTMVPGADAMLEALRPLNEASGPLFKLRRDPRVTRFGRRLRRWSLDELPQLVNVLRGEMSLVGPRPPLPEEVRNYEQWHYDRLSVAPGITGLWQVNGRSELSFDDYVRLDLFYAENWSLGFDVFLLLKTIPVLMSGKGAY